MSPETPYSERKICLYCDHWNLDEFRNLHGECLFLMGKSGEKDGLDFYGSGEEFLTGPAFGCIHWESDSPGQGGVKNEEE